MILKFLLNHWLVFIIAIFLIAFLFLVMRQRMARKKPKVDLTKESMDNIVKSIGQSEKMEALYMQLIRKIHPDRNPGKVELANEFTQKLNDNRKSWSGLTQVQKEIEQEFK